MAPYRVYDSHGGGRVLPLALGYSPSVVMMMVVVVGLECL